MVYQDRELTCADCGTSFTFSADDQQYHAEKGYTNEPRRCSACRDVRRSERRQGGGSGLDGGYPRQMHPIVCAQCGKDAEVPFRPTGERPVYCNDCYGQTRSSGGGGRY